MSSSGIRKFKTMQDRQVDLMINQESNFIGALKVTGTEQSLGGIVSLGEATGGGPGAPVGNFLETGGGTMIGPIAYFPQEVTIDSDDNINIGFEQGAYSTYIRVTTGGATDDLINIIGAQFSGQDLVLQGTTGKTISIKTTGNIVPPSGADFDLVDDDLIRAIFDDIQNKWVFWAGTGSDVGHLEDRIVDDNTFAIVIDAVPSFSVSLDGIQAFSIQTNRVDFEDQQIFGIEQLRLNDDPGTGEFLTFGAFDASTARINILNDLDSLDITHAGDLSARFQDGRFQLFSKSPNTLSASMSLFKDDPSPLPNDAVGDIDFDGRDLGGNFTTYASILVGIEQAIEGAEEGRFTFQVAGGSGTGGVLKQAMRIAPDRIEMDDVWITMDEISLPTNPDADKGKIYVRDILGTTSLMFLDTAGVETNLLAESDRITDDDTIAIVNDSTKTFIVLLDGVQKFSIQETRIDLESLEVFGVEKLWFDDSVGSPTMVSMGANGVSFFDINVLDDTEAINITFAGDDGFRFADGRLQIFSQAPNTLSASTSWFRDDPSPTATDALSDLDFDGRNSNGDFTTYVQIIGGIGDPLLNNEEGNVSIQVQGGSGSLVQAMRIGHIGAFNTIIMDDAYIELDEISLPTNPATDKGKIYVRSDGGISTPYFLDQAGTETSMILAGGGSGGAGDNFHPSCRLIGRLDIPNTNAMPITQDITTSFNGDRILLVNQDDKATNGIWEILSGTNPKVLGRPSDFAASSVRLGMDMVSVTDGKGYAGTTWVMRTRNVTVDTTDQDWEDILISRNTMQGRQGQDFNGGSSHFDLRRENVDRDFWGNYAHITNTAGTFAGIANAQWQPGSVVYLTSVVANTMTLTHDETDVGEGSTAPQITGFWLSGAVDAAFDKDTTFCFILDRLTSPDAKSYWREVSRTVGS